MPKEMLFEGKMGDFQEFLDLMEGKPCLVTIKPVADDKLRTLQQNKAIHKDCANTAKILNDNNVSAKDMFACSRAEIPVNEVMVKELWHAVMIALGLPPKTSKLNTKQVSEVREIVERALAKRLGVDIGPFPSLDF
jgi:hypothetical protein